MDFLLVRAVSPDVVVTTARETLSVVVAAAAGVGWGGRVITLGAGLGGIPKPRKGAAGCRGAVVMGVSEAASVISLVLFLA